MKLLLAAAAALTLTACATHAPVGIASTPEPARAPVTILISIDGFHPDYLTRGVTPNLNALASAGASARMRPSFPSKTFPNHWTLVTGFRPDRHGIVGNRMFDATAPKPDVAFTMQNDDPFWWSAAEPIWITAERAGVRSATMFWPGSNVAFAGRRPSDWQDFNQNVTNPQRVAAIIDWLRRPAAARPKLLTLYFDTVDTVGHRAGPDSADTTAAVAEVDERIGDLRRELAALGQPANLIVVSDHGMAATSETRVVDLRKYASPNDYRVVEDGPYAGIDALPGREGALAAALARVDGPARCYPKASLPPALAFGRNPRVPAFICLADVGWTILAQDPRYPLNGASHGWDPSGKEMAAIFIASGPGIARAGTLPTFDNVAVAPFLRRLLGLPDDATLDGTAAPLRPALKR